MLVALGEEAGDGGLPQEDMRVLLGTLLDSAKTPGVRAAAVRISSNLIPRTGTEQTRIVINQDVRPDPCLDPDPRVRLEGVRRAANLKSSQAVEAALAVLDKPMDRTLDYALWLTVRELEPYWLPEFQGGKLTFGGDAKKLAFALNAIGNKDTVKPVLALIDGGKVPKENVQGLYLLLTQIGGPEELSKVMAYAGRDSGITTKDRNELAGAVEEAIRTRKVAAPKTALGLQSLLADKDAARRSALRIAGLWKLDTARAIVDGLANSTEAVEPADRAAALDALALYGDAKAKELLTKLASNGQPAIQRQAVAALATLDLTGAANIAARYLEHAKPEPEIADMITAIVTRKGGPTTLAKALQKSVFDSSDVAKIALKAVRASGQPADDLIAALTKSGDLGAMKKPPTDAEVKALAADALKLGDAARGELVYRRKELQCLACHAYAGAGGQVGPDLTSIGASAQPDYLVDSLLLPHKAIKEGFDVTRVVTTDDKVLQGIKIREANGVLVLRTAEDKEVTIPVKDIAERSKSTKSLMPEGITDQLTKQEFADLVKYLTELGKVGGNYAPSKARFVRRWQVIDATPANLNMFRRTRVSAAAEGDNPFAWSSTYGKVSGDLPLAELPKFTVWNDTAPQSVIRFQLDVTAAGTAKLKLNATTGLTVYLGNTPIEPKAETILDLKTGTQTVTILIDRSKRTEDLRIELDDVEKSPARVSVVGGK
jgi:putative heme-binding domain-containing protein